MNQTEQVLLQAIQKSLWGTDVAFPADTDWNAVLKEAEDQAVLGLVAPIAPADVQQAWKSKVSTVTVQFVRILHYQEELYRLLKEHGIPMVILKGTAAAIYYPNPSQRSMGDIDYLVPQEHFDRAKELLAQNGYTIEDDPKYPRHIHVIKDGISFEQHRYFSYAGIEVERFILDGFEKTETGMVFGTEFPLLPKLANGLVLLGHATEHLRTGLGLRQVIDWMMYVELELKDTFWKQSFEAAAKDAGLDIVAVAVTRLCQLYLGLKEDIQWCKGADADLCAELLNSLITSGNFNRKRSRESSSVEIAASSIAKKGLLRYLQIAGESNWKAYQKHKWLKPFAGIYQIGRYFKKVLQSKLSGGQLKEDLNRGKQRSKLLKQLGIKE